MLFIFLFCVCFICFVCVVVLFVVVIVAYCTCLYGSFVVYSVWVCLFV